MSVISCERTTTLEGYSSIHAVVELKNDGMMREVNDNVRLHFTFVREPQQNNTANDGDSKGEAVRHADTDDDNHDVDVDESRYSDSGDAEKRKRNEGSEKSNKRTCTQQQDDDETSNDTTDNNNYSFTPKTIVTYKIDMSVDYGQMKTLLGVDIYALGEHPSVEEAVPMMHEEDGGDEDEDDVDQMAADGQDNESEAADCDGVEEEERGVPNSKEKALSKGNDEFEEIDMEDTEDSAQGDAGKGDRFGVFVDPQSIVGFLDRVNMNLNEQSVIYFLLTLPLYEHEWNISGFVLSSFDDVEMDEDEDGCAAE